MTRPRRLARGLLISALLTGVAVVAVVALRSRQPATDTLPGTTAAGAVTASVVRTTLVSRKVVTGQLGFAHPATVTNYQDQAVLTWTPTPGTIVTRGHTLCRLDGRAVVLLYGHAPAWRAFRPGMSPGADVAALNANLAALGYEPRQPAAQRQKFSWDTDFGLRRLQQAEHEPVTGTAPLGSLVLLPGPARIGHAAQPLGAPLSAGASILTTTADTPAVTVAIDPATAARIHRHDPVSVTLPDGTSAPARVTAIDPVATIPDNQSGDGAAQPTITITIGFDHRPQSGITDQAPVEVAITDQRIPHTLAVPVTALLARPDGGYALVPAADPARLIPIQLGLFDDTSGLVQISGTGIAAGLKVQAAVS